MRTPAAARGQELPPPAPQPEWEVCDITYRVVRGRLFGKPGFRFHAWSIGPEGSRPIADSERFTADPRQEGASREEFDALLARLRADGWEPTGEHGGRWYSVRLRRPLKFGANGASGGLGTG